MICWARLSRWMPSRVNTCTSMTVPLVPWSTRSDVSFTSEAFSPKIARSSFSSGVSVVSPFGRDLADQRVARVHFGADVDDARLVETSQLVLRQVRDVAGDFLGAQLGVARHDHQLLDVDRGVAVFGDHALADEDRVLEVVAVPGHERDQHVLAERQLADVGRGAVGNDVLGVDLVAALDDRALVDVRVLVRALVLDQVVDVDADLARHRLLVVDADDDAVGVDVVDDAAALGGDDGARVLGGDALDAGADERLSGRRVGTAWRCMFAPMSARFASSCSRNGTSEAATETICVGATSMYWIRSAEVSTDSPLSRAETSSSIELAFGVERRARLGDHVLAFSRSPTGSRSGSSPCRRRPGGTASRGSRTR